MKIRPPTRSELPACETVLCAAFEPFARRLGRHLDNTSFSDLQHSAAKYHLLVALDGSLIKGVAVCTAGGDIWAIDQIAVNPADQGNGIGSALLRRIERDAAGSGANALKLNTPEIMTDLLRLYHRHGFSAVRKGLPEHRRDQFTRVFMQKTIEV